METFIDPSNFISKEVQIGTGVTIGPFNVINGPVKIGDGCKIGSFNHITGKVEIGNECEVFHNASIKGTTFIGNNCKIWPFSSIGNDPQDIKFKGEAQSELYVGNNCIIREYVSISRGTEVGGGKTVLGDDCFLLSGSHVGHDCLLGNNVTLVSQTLIGGSCKIGNHVSISALSFIIPKTRVGDYAMMGAFSYLRMDATPFSIIVGNENPKVWKTNTIRLKRCGFSNEDIAIAEKIFNTYFKKNLTSQDALSVIDKEFKDHKLSKIFMDFVKSAEKGVLR